MTELPGLTLNGVPFPLNSVPFPGLLASDEHREAYEQHRLALDNQPPPPPPAPIEPGPNLLDLIMDLNRAAREEGRAEGREAGRQEGREEGLEEGREAGREAGREEGREAGRQEGRQEGREAEREARRCKMTLQARQDAQQLQRLMDSRGLGLNDAGKELSKHLMQKGAHFKTAANRVSLAKNALKRDLVTG
jgi:hypothetical protein